MERLQGGEAGERGQVAHLGERAIERLQGAEVCERRQVAHLGRRSNRAFAGR